METQETIQKQPLVSVVIPAHNEEKWIPTCLESVLKTDDYPNKEVIVVDDASSDGTSDILRRFPVKVIRNEKPAGPSSARNIGVREAKGEVIVSLDAHCIIDDPEWIQKYLQLFRDPEVGAASGYFRKSRGRTPLRFRVTAKPRLFKSGNGAYRKVVFEQVGGFEPSLEWVGDAALTFRILRSRWKIVHSRDIRVVHAEKLFSLRRTFMYGTCFFRLLKRYPRETIGKKPEIYCLGTGLLLTLGLFADFLFKLPIFAFSLLLLFTVINGAARKVSVPCMLRDGFYSTIWSFVYYLGALCGGACSALLLGSR